MAIDQPFDQEKDGDNSRSRSTARLSCGPPCAGRRGGAREGCRIRTGPGTSGGCATSVRRASPSGQEEDWANAWKEHYLRPPRRSARVIRPPWREYDAKPDDVVLNLDPGMAFGTGLHPSTQLRLIALEERMRPGMRVLDVGVGLGVLTIAAAKHGAASIDAVDVEAVAVRVTNENIARNDLTDADHGGGWFGRTDRTPPRCAVRIGCRQHHRPDHRRTRPRAGRGLRAGRSPDHLRHHRRAFGVEIALAAGLIEIERHDLGDWCCVEGRRAKYEVRTTKYERMAALRPLLPCVFCDEESTVADELGCGSPIPLSELAALFAGMGGSLVDRGRLGDRSSSAGPREHIATLMQINRDDQLAFQAALATWDPRHAADPPGTLRPWRRGEVLPPGVQDVFCRPGPTAPWAFQFNLADTLGDQWVFRRDRRVRRSLAALTRRSDEGLPHVAPEVQLLFKARATPRPKDEQDFAVAHGLLDEEARAWLAGALALYSPDHPRRARPGWCPLPRDEA
ncbi:MAG: 50S ribosomal protein L11 methyltransferase [Chloroflexia bacterium]